MTYVLLEHRLRSHPKAARAGAEAMWLYVCSVLWSDEHGTDGWVPHEALEAIGVGIRRQRLGYLADRLTTVGLWESDDPDWRIHDYTDYQRSAVEAEAERDLLAKRRAADRARKQRQRLRQANGVPGAVT